MKHAWLENEAQAECRTLTGHRWYELVGERTIHGQELHVAHRCAECKSTRHKWFNVWTGEITARWYEYSDGYAIVYGTKDKRLSRAAIRAMYLKRLFKGSRQHERRRRAG